jgi:Reverse transcriptase (RNA-dependent DNA polymerase)
VQSGRIHLDISSVRNHDYEDSTSKPYWQIIVDERTQMKFSDFFASKNGMVEPTCQLVQNLRNTVWTAVDKDTLKATNKVLTTTWAMKKKPNGSYRARINARGFKQLDGLHYDSSATSPPVTNDTTIRVIFTLAMLAGWKGYVIDVKGAFLNGRLDKGEELFLTVPQGFEQFYKESQVLKLNRTIYGLKQAAQAFWTKLLRALTAMGFVRSDGDSCCYYKNVSEKNCMFVMGR